MYEQNGTFWIAFAITWLTVKERSLENSEFLFTKKVSWKFQKKSFLRSFKTTCFLDHSLSDSSLVIFFKSTMSDRGKNHFIRAFQAFYRSLKPSAYRSYAHPGIHVGTDYLGNKYYEIPPSKWSLCELISFRIVICFSVNTVPERGRRNPKRWFTPERGQTATDYLGDWDQKIPPEWNGKFSMLTLMFTY